MALFFLGSLQIGRVCSIGLDDLEVEWYDETGSLMGKTLEKSQVKKLKAGKRFRFSSHLSFKFISLIVAISAFIAFLASLISYYFEEEKVIRST